MSEYSSNGTSKSSRNGSKFAKSDNHGEAVLLETEQAFFTENNKSDDPEVFSPDELETNNTQPSTTFVPSKIPIRSNSSLQFKSHTRNKFRQIPSSTTNKRVFRTLTSSDQRTVKPRFTSTDDDDLETDHLKEDDLKVKLKEEKRQGKKTEELLTKLHENYEELLEKYAQAENTIDQLRFQPKIIGDNTPRSNTSEHLIHLTQQSKVNIATLRSSGAYRSTTGSPLSSIRPVLSSTPTTATPARKSASPTNSGTIESIFFDEVIPETLKLDLLIETRTLGNKMKSFLTSMDANQLSLAEQKQVYQIIKQDYEQLMKEFDQNKHNLAQDSDLNKELETMKQLLKEIVKKITDNLLGKSATNSFVERQTNDDTHSSQASARSALCNHNDLMNQYQKLLNAVNIPRGDSIKSVTNEFQSNSKIEHQQPIKTKQKPYIYVSGDSDDEQQVSDGITPFPYTKGVTSTSLELDYIPSTSMKHSPIQEQRYEILHPKQTSYSISRMNDYDNEYYPSKLNESRFQSLDDEQESISPSSRSNSSDSASPRSPYRKRFNKRSIHRRKSSHLSFPIDSDLETHLTGSFEIQPQTSSKTKNMHRNYHTWKPHRSRLTPAHRSLSIITPSIEDYRTRPLRPLITPPRISSKIPNDPPSAYRSSIYIDQIHTHERSDGKLYFDPQTGVVYRYESEKISNPPRIYYEPSSSKLYQCADCGSVNTYHHRHHIDASVKRVTTQIEDLGYESGHQKRSRRYRYTDYLSSSDSDSDLSPSYLQMSALNQAYHRAEKVRHQSRYLSRCIVRQLKLALATL